jgi:hypothetical protein
MLLLEPLRRVDGTLSLQFLGRAVEVTYALLRIKRNRIHDIEECIAHGNAKNESTTSRSAFPVLAGGLAEMYVACVCTAAPSPARVLLCFIEPIVGGMGPGASSLRDC